MGSTAPRACLFGTFSLGVYWKNHLGALCNLYLMLVLINLSKIAKVVTSTRVAQEVGAHPAMADSLVVTFRSGDPSTRHILT